MDNINDVDKFCENLSNEELLDVFCDNLDDQIPAELFRAVQARKLLWVVNCELPADPEEAKVLVRARLEGAH